ncbi:MAG: pyruvate formate lyase family protein [Candidatus Geothermincolia bacterium]
MLQEITVEPSSLWSPAETLSPRVRRLRQEYFSFSDRPYFQNEVLPFTVGTEWDQVYSPINWGDVPEVLPFIPAFRDSLRAIARRVDMPDGFFQKPLPVRRALFFAEVVRRHLPIHILEGELIVGGQFNSALSRCLDARQAGAYEKRNKRWLKRLLKVNEAGMGNCGAIPGHLIPDYPRVLREGLRGMVEDFRAQRAGADPARRDMLDALIIACEAVRDLACRYADEAARLAGEETDPSRAAELREIARICARVPWEPAEGFHEALQSLWLTHMMAMTAESYPGPGLSHGRIDQYLYPYYSSDLASGAMDRAWARELLDCYFIKHNYAYDYQARVGSNQGINSGFGQLITLGGIDSDGNDASNDLTWLFLDVIEEMNMLEPKPNVRLHQKTPDALLRRLAEMVARAQGAPFLLNFDEISMKALAYQGLPPERLWDYAPVGCLENTLQGDDRSGTVDVNINLAKAVEMVFFRGKDQTSGKRIGVDTGDPVAFSSWESFRDAYWQQLKCLIDKVVELNNEADALRAEFEPTPYLSALVGGCAESGKDVAAGGPRHSYLTVEAVALGTAADSLAAVRKLVFDEKRVTMAELTRALADNYEGHDALRLTLARRAPKYGNDDDYADAVARDIHELWTGYVKDLRSPATGKRYRAGYLSWNYWIAYAPLVAATPDGRRRGTYLSNGIGPVDGAEHNGPTAVSLSVGKLGMEKVPNGDSHTISLSPALLRDDEHIEKLMGFLRAYGEVGGTALQINVLNPETLRAAQRDPEKYSNLLVRVTGYNAYFVMLGKEMQDEIIARESHRL